MNAAAGYANGNGQPRTVNTQAGPMSDSQNGHVQHPSQSTTIVRFETNVPVEVALSRRQPDDPIVDGQYGQQALYYLTGGRRMYVSMIVADKIAKLSPDPEEPFIICKREVKNGQRRSIEWQVYRPQPAPKPPVSAAQPDSPAPRPQSAPLPQDVTWDDIDRPAPVAPPTQPPAPRPGVVGNSADTRSPNRRTQMTSFLEDALCAAVDAVSAAQKYAAERGLMVKIDDAQLQDLASTAGINWTREQENLLRYGWKQGGCS